MKLLLPFVFLMSFEAKAWSLNNNFGASFEDSKVDIKIAGNAPCDPTKAGVTPGELMDLIKPAVEKFWNSVPTSRLQLRSAGASENITNIYSGRLCSPTDTSCISSAGGNLIPPVNDIIVACNDEQDNFQSHGVLAVTVPNKFSGKKIVGSVILINDFSNSFGSLSREDKISVLAHEIGHAIGLGHSKRTEALMYYRASDLQRKLAQDDIDGLNYLYGIHLDLYGLMSENGGLLGGCGTITTSKNEPPKNPPFFQMVISLAALVGIFELVRLLRSKTRSSF